MRKDTGIRMRWGWVYNKRGPVKESKILGMDNNIIVLAHVHRNVIEKVKLCKLFLWFGLIKST